jgi:hypothetical protein
MSACHPELAEATPEKGNSGAVKRLERNSRDGGSSVTSRASIGSSGMTVNAKAAQNVGRSPLRETQGARAASAKLASALYNLLSLMQPGPSQEKISYQGSFWILTCRHSAALWLYCARPEIAVLIDFQFPNGKS